MWNWPNHPKFVTHVCTKQDYKGLLKMYVKHDLSDQVIWTSSQYKIGLAHKHSLGIANIIIHNNLLKNLAFAGRCTQMVPISED